MSDKQARTTETPELHNETAIKEVHQLLKSRVENLTPDIINRLKSKYSDSNVVDSIMEYFSDRRAKIVKVANIFMNAFERKYRNEFQTISFSKFRSKANKYKAHYKLSDDEFDEILRIFNARLYNTSPSTTQHVIYPNTTLSRVLGYPVTESTEPIKPANSDDYSYLQDILRTYEMSKGIHSHIVIQTMLYTDMAEEAMNGMFNPEKHDINRYVHPVLAAMFLPKIPILEERAGIMNTRYNRERIITKPDYELFYSMIVDPADTICDGSSPMKDIKNRAEVQIQLWNNVYNLRNGRYYDSSVMDFIAYIDKCRVSNYDNPDLLYLMDEGVILRRLFSIFSFRPIIVSTQPIFGMITSNPFNLPINQRVITSIPYITYKLPDVKVEGQNYNLNDAVNQVQFYMENGVFVPKTTQIIDVRGPLVFYIPRKYVGLPIKATNPQLSPFGFTKLAESSRHYQQINGVEIDYDQSLIINPNNIGNSKTYYLRSVVALEKYDASNIVLGHMSYLFRYPRDTTGNIVAAVPEISVYVPRRANLAISKRFPILVDNEMNTRATISTCGTIFVYADC
jgi:hypothetical protein